MKHVRVPKAFHELFGLRIPLLELVLILLFCAGMSAVLLGWTYPEWRVLAGWKIVLLVALTIDITGGVIANFACSTNDYYRSRARTRLLFIAVHIQPILLALLFGEGYWASILVWGYTGGAALLVNALFGFPSQRMIAAILAISGIVLLLFSAGHIPSVLLALWSLFMFKVIFSFAVDHDAARSH
ncbi:hypothetical protein DUZ99_10300 [Xylanibacillus composti]|uniref:Uncharacterized protein n=1 Tax=Xylanibacillus composti TaxID=1572762 RepID=A0A8J4M2H2_9BACL|nr:hypothetical protein [Xylanibacillus composti]MDT9725361.1 hypothetical protein [Xylanibacillus composti]GIQ69125.1 hypothetical protein XYCOK13_19490 [Xylanibacillus composti]